MELRHLRYFVAVAEELHFGRAAERLFIGQPALSRQVMALERELGVELFLRTKRRVTLSPAGEVFYPEARAILQRADKAVDTAKSTARGEIGSLDIGYIGPAMWSVLPPVLREHRRRYPGIHFHMHELGGGAQLALLRDGSLDIAFLRPFPVDDSFAYEPVLREPYLIGLPTDHPQAANERVDLADLKDETFIIIPRRLSPVVYDQYLALCNSYGFSPTVEEGNSPSALNLVSMGLGVGLVPESFQNAPWNGIVFRPLSKQTATIELGVAYQRDNHSAPAAAFLETVRDVVTVD